LPLIETDQTLRQSLDSCSNAFRPTQGDASVRIERLAFANSPQCLHGNTNRTAKRRSHCRHFCHHHQSRISWGFLVGTDITRINRKTFVLGIELVTGIRLYGFNNSYSFLESKELRELK
jgi:hypothetical protein